MPPPPRFPVGPAVAACPCCHKVVYYNGMGYRGLTLYPNLLLPNFPRVLGTIATCH